MTAKTRTISILAILVLMSLPVWAAPELTIKSEKFYFGIVPQQATIRTGFWLNSTGDDTVKISQIKTGCSCVMVPFERNEIPPGDSLFLELTWDLKNSVSKAGKYPYIYTNVREEPFRVYMDALVSRNPDSTKVAYCRPYALELANVGGKLIDSLGFEITNKFEHDLMIEVISPPVEQCEISLPENVPAFGKINGFVKIKSGFTNEEFKTSYTIRLTDPEGTTFTVPVRYRLIGVGGS